MDFFRDVCQTRPRQIFFLCVSGILQAAMFVYSVALFGVGLHILLIVTDKIGPILDEDIEHLSIGISLELLSGVIAGIGLCNAFVCIVYPCAIYTVLNLENHKLHRKKIVSFSLSHVVLGFGILCIGVLCLLQRNRLDSNLPAAIMNTLPHYRSRMELKTSIDKMQIYYQCCGGKSLLDWSEIEWYRSNSPDQNSVNAAAPFSCCSRFSMSPCLVRVHIDLLNIVLKSPLKDIWYTQGCAEVVIRRFSSSLLLPIGVVSIIFFVLQMLGTYVSYLILSLMNEQKPKRKCQKLHFDMENFTHDDCDHDQLGYESSSSSSSESLIPLRRHATLQILHDNQRQNYELFAKDRKDSKEENKSFKKGETARDTHDTAEVEVPITAAMLYDHYDDEDGGMGVNMNVNTEHRNGSAAKNDPEVVPVERVHDKSETMAEGNIGERQNAVDKELYNADNKAALQAMHKTDRIIGESDTDDEKQLPLPTDSW